jgi:hypothetical protein
MAKRQTGAARTPGQREKDLVRESELYRRGVSFSKMAVEINLQAKERGDDYEITYQAIFHDLKSIRKRWVAEQDKNIGEWVAEQLKLIEDQIQRYTIAWERSLEDAETMTTKTGGGEDGDGFERTHRVEGKSGNSAFLAGIDRQIEMRNRILHITDSGAAIPQSVEMTAKEIEKATEAFEAAAPGGGGLFVDYGTGEGDETEIDEEESDG